MAAFPTSRYCITFSFLILYFKPLIADSNSSFSFKDFGKDSKFESQIALYGDAEFVNGGSSVQITGPWVSSSGRVMYKKPIKFLSGKPTKLVSFSTLFTFSLSPENGDGLAFVVVPIGFPLNVFDGGSFGLLGKSKFRVLAVELDTLKDGKVNVNHVGIDVSGFVSVKVGNVSTVNLVLNSGEKLQAWIDYEAASRRLEVRLSKLGKKKPVDPLLFYPIDLSRIWTGGEVFVGLSSSNGKSSQTCNVYSWSFKLRPVPDWMHSQPIDPQALKDKMEDRVVAHKRSDCFLRVLAALILGTGIGALGSFVVLFTWTIFGNRRPIVPEEFTPKPVEYDYKNFKVVVDKSTENGKQ